MLYVGGRPGLIDQLKAVAARRGGTLISHDGGIEENLAALPGLVSRADAVFFPIDCISHAAVGQIKKYCRDGHKPFIPLRTASAASFIATIGHQDALQNSRLAALRALFEKAVGIFSPFGATRKPEFSLSTGQTTGETRQDPTVKKMNER